MGRFRLLGPESKKTLANLNSKFGVSGQFEAVPDYLVVSMVPVKTKDFSVWTTNALEDHAATACAVQNFMLSCASQGIATKWMTGKMGVSGADMLSKCCGVDADSEHYMGTLLVGRADKPLASMKMPARKKTVSAVFEVTD